MEATNSPAGAGAAREVDPGLRNKRSLETGKMQSPESSVKEVGV